MYIVHIQISPCTVSYPCFPLIRMNQIKTLHRRCTHTLMMRKHRKNIDSLQNRIQDQSIPSCTVCLIQCGQMSMCTYVFKRETDQYVHDDRSFCDSSMYVQLSMSWFLPLVTCLCQFFVNGRFCAHVCHVDRSLDLTLYKTPSSTGGKLRQADPGDKAAEPAVAAVEYHYQVGSLCTGPITNKRTYVKNKLFPPSRSYVIHCEPLSTVHFMRTDSTVLKASKKSI